MVRAGLLDTSVIIDWHDPAVQAALPDQTMLSTISLAELAIAPLRARDPREQARRQARLQQIEEAFDPLDFDRPAARSYGAIVAAVTIAGRSHRTRTADLLIAAVAHSRKLPLYTRNAGDLRGLDGLVDVRPI